MMYSVLSLMDLDIFCSVIRIPSCHSDLFGIFLEKDSGQARMTKSGKDSRQAGMTELCNFIYET